MCQNITAGIISGIVTAVILWLSTNLWSINASKIVRIQAKRMQSILLSINNDITWGVEDERDDYYDNIIQKIPLVLQSADIAKESISMLNFRFFNRRKFIIKQLNEIIESMECLLNEVEGAAPKYEKNARLMQMRAKYQTSGSIILYYRAQFLENLTKFSSVQSALEAILYDENVEVITEIYNKLKRRK